MDASVSNRSSTQTSTSINIFNPVESLCLSLGPRQRIWKTNNNNDFAMEMEDSNDPTSSVSSNEYGYLKHIQTYKPLCRSNDKSLSIKVR